MTPDALLAAGFGWAIFEGEDGLHSVPINDMRPHVLSAECWCCPVGIDDEDEDPIWSHNSMDRREHTIEQGIFQ